MHALPVAAPARRLAVAALAGIAVAGCATTSVPEPTPVAATPGAAATAQASPAPSKVASASPGAAETLSCEPLGGPLPRYSVTVPGSWSGYEGECGFVVPDGEGFTAGLSVWIVGRVPTDPCRNTSTLVTPADGVDGLVQAILAQEGRNTTDPGSPSVNTTSAGTVHSRYVPRKPASDTSVSGGLALAHRRLTRGHLQLANQTGHRAVLPPVGCRDALPMLWPPRPR